jgi:hypothetical protein
VIGARRSVNGVCRRDGVIREQLGFFFRTRVVTRSRRSPDYSENLLQVNVQSVHIAEVEAEGREVGTVWRKALKAATYGASQKKRFAEIKCAIDFSAAGIPAEDCFLWIEEVLKVEITAFRSPLISAHVSCARQLTPLPLAGIVQMQSFEVS